MRLQSSLQCSPSSRDVKTRSKDQIFKDYFHKDKAKVSIGPKSKQNIEHSSLTTERDTILDVYSLPQAFDEYPECEERSNLKFSEALEIINENYNTETCNEDVLIKYLFAR